MHELPEGVRAVRLNERQRRVAEIQNSDGRHRFFDLPSDPGNRLQTTEIVGSGCLETTVTFYGCATRVPEVGVKR